MRESDICSCVFLKMGTKLKCTFWDHPTFTANVFCGGVIISSNVIATAGHCLSEVFQNSPIKILIFKTKIIRVPKGVHIYQTLSYPWKYEKKLSSKVLANLKKLFLTAKMAQISISIGQICNYPSLVYVVCQLPLNIFFRGPKGIQ